MKHLRKLPIILTLAGLTLFISCNNDGDEPKKNHKPISTILTFGRYDYVEIITDTILAPLSKQYDIIYSEPIQDWTMASSSIIMGLTGRLIVAHDKYEKQTAKGGFIFSDTIGTRGAPERLK
ncbi:MAG: hypothetical protein IJ180_11690 [Bacteroidales bacterium]|nr:hypothetical protein [Bacteroidales bacterium]MBQ9255420.1 hypothetical protein [Bacteroidales bacterium]